MLTFESGNLKKGWLRKFKLVKALTFESESVKCWKCEVLKALTFESVNLESGKKCLQMLKRVTSY